MARRRIDRGSALGLHIPADAGSSVEIVRVEMTSVAISELIGGGLLDEGLQGAVGHSWFTFYVDEDRVAKRLPPNERATALSVWLDRTDQGRGADLRGDVLVLGLDHRFEDVDVPLAVVMAAAGAGLLTQVHTSPG